MSLNNMALVLLMLLAFTLSGAFSNPATTNGLPPTTTPCWTKIQECPSTINNTMPDAYVKQCCPIIKEQFDNETLCICSINPLLKQLQANNPDAPDYVQQVYFTGCNIPGSMDSICAGWPQKILPAGGSNRDAANSYNRLGSALILFLMITLILY